MASEVTGGDLLTLWKVSKVHLPRVADVFGTASQLLGSGGDGGEGTADAADAFTSEGRPSDIAYYHERGNHAKRPSYDQPSKPGGDTGPIYPHWVQLRNELQYLTATTAQYALDASDAVNTALNMFRGVDEDNAGATTDVGKEFDAMIEDPNWVDPNRPENNPPDEPPAEPEYPTDDKGDPYVSPYDHRSAATPPADGQGPV